MNLKSYMEKLLHRSPWLRYQRYIFLPKIMWYVTGMFLWDAIYSYYWLNIAKREPLWPDADSSSCQFRYCRFCGKGKV